MSFKLNNQLKEDAHQVYLPLANEISKYKNLKFIVVSRFVGFDKSSFIKRKIKIKMISMNSLSRSSGDFLNQKHLGIGLINISDIIWIMMSL